MNEDKKIMALKPNGTEAEEKEVVAIEESMDLVLKRAEQQVDLLKRVLAIAVKRTTHYDWIDQMGKPYLTASGAEKLMPVFGVNVKDTDYKKEFSKDEEGQYYIYQYKGTFSWKGGSIEAIGACSSRDKFFAWDSKEQAYKPLSQVDETNIMKAAYSNMMVNGITRLLGIRNLTWEMLTEFGIDKNRAAKVEYKTGSQGGTTKSEQEKQMKLYRLMRPLVDYDESKLSDALESLTSFKNKDGKVVKGVKSLKILKGKRLDIAIGKAKQQLKDDLGMDDKIIEEIERGELND